MEKKYAKNNKIVAFMKRNMYYIIMGVCVVAIGAMITVALVSQNKPDIGGGIINTEKPDEKPVEKPDVGEDPVVKPEPIVFSSPVANGKIIKDYTITSPVYWPTLNHYAVHRGIDFAGADGAKAVAVYKGTVLSVKYDVLDGNVVKIDHGNGLVSSYGSLGTPLVAEGQTVEKGTELGVISTSASREMGDGAHVHFAVYQNNKIINPYDYLPSGDK